MHTKALGPQSISLNVIVSWGYFVESIPTVNKYVSPAEVRPKIFISWHFKNTYMEKTIFSLVDVFLLC